MRNFTLHSSCNHYSIFWKRQPFFSSLSLRSVKSLRVNVLYIKGEFRLFSKFRNCQCERSTRVTHAASNTHLILITPPWRLHAHSCSQRFSSSYLIFDRSGVNSLCSKDQLLINRTTHCEISPFNPLTSCVLLHVIYSFQPF